MGERSKKIKIKFADKKNLRIFAVPFIETATFFAEIAQLVEHDLAKVGVASSSLVFRSQNSKNAFQITWEVF